ncbi:MAG: beta-N-acetylglucosaminidase domain-containing protein [bacterium]
MKNKFFGVVEGFYRKPYTFRERLDLIKFLSVVGLDTYVYGPKQDIYHREKWFAEYPQSKMREFKELNMLSSSNNVCFNYALSPMSEPETNKIINKIHSMVEIGISQFSLFYDDITVPLNKKTALKQTATANELLMFIKKKISKPTLFFCPTQYHGFKETEYIKTIYSELNKNIEIFWTGPKIVSKKIDLYHLKKITILTKRKPLIWDNLFANDYLPGIILKFPYRYRAPQIVGKTCGILINPMNQYRASKPLIYTAAEFIKAPYKYVPRKAWKKATRFLK